jgi:type II secretory pathway pseudopilin PulG
MNYIKTNHQWARQRGTTLVELSVVIAVILLLVGVLFIGVQAWRDGANKSACLVNMASIQKAVRGEENVNLLTPGTSPLASTTLVTDGYFGALPKCPVGPTDYTYLALVPAQGTPYATCASANAATHNPTAVQTANW